MAFSDLELFRQLWTVKESVALRSVRKEMGENSTLHKYYAPFF